MDLQSCLKAPLLALTLLSMVIWVPHMYSSLRNFSVSLPSADSTVTVPKCLFIFSNAIVVFLISESKLSGRSDSGSSDDGDVARGDTVHRQQEDVVKAVMSPAIIEESEEEEESSVTVKLPADDIVLVHEGYTLIDQYHEEPGVAICEAEESRELQEEGGIVDVHEEAREEEECEGEEGEEEEAADELNQRVEDFIARFNMERRLEARMLVCCC